MELNGIAHIQLTVSNFEACERFYEKLLPFFEMRELFSTGDLRYWVGSRTGLAITRCAPQYASERFAQRRVGLHHFCFRARQREDVDTIYQFLLQLSAKIVHPPEEGPWAPGYYSVLFEDPDGIRLEVNYVPGKGNFAEGINLPLPFP
jgi:catechol 2,3-dioxygenase-like lactoylglutathione lyase family enzyme